MSSKSEHKPGRPDLLTNLKLNKIKEEKKSISEKDMLFWIPADSVQMINLNKQEILEKNPNTDKTLADINAKDMESSRLKINGKTLFQKEKSNTEQIQGIRMIAISDFLEQEVQSMRGKPSPAHRSSSQKTWIGM